MRIKIEDLPELYRNQVERTLSFMESSHSPSPLQEKAIKGLDSQLDYTFTKPVKIHYHSKRRRLADADGLCTKYFTDGLVLAGVLKDDGQEYVKEVTHTQEKTDGEEETIIRIQVV